MNKASVSLRTLLDLRDNLAAEDSQIRQIEQSIRIQLDNRDSLSKQLAGLSDNAESLRENDNGASTRARLLDEIDEGEKNCTRVLAQLHRDLDVRSQRRNTSASKVHRLEQELRVVYTSLRQILLNFRDPLYRPFHIEAGKPLRNYVLQSLAARERGLSVQPIRCVSTTAGSAVANQRRAVLMSRISHAATINTHLAYPIYCLRFDKSGRYFITGADDCLARVFAMGGTNQGNAHHPTTPVARHVASDSSLRYARGAVLVCTLRGHAGVINDIDVSSDNSFLATASEDGDCRVWGLKDGCPVAILRGHVGGANMVCKLCLSRTSLWTGIFLTLFSLPKVSWSTLTPYRLVTTGADGYARTWDVREACLKRYGKVIGRRPEYRLQSTSKIPNQDRLASSTSSLSPCQTPPPRSDQPHAPLNARQDGEEHMRSSGAGFQMQSAASPQEPSIPLPPLPPPQNAQAQPVPLPLPPLPPAAPQGNENIDEGAFVANDVMDEGVKLLSRLKHTHEEDVLSPGARSRRAPIKVICLARCPHGGHFATGSDDGVCRVWRDEDDPVVNQIDSRFFSSRDHQLGDDRRNADDRSSDSELFFNWR
jgi:WD40 repeat protein